MKLAAMTCTLLAMSLAPASHAANPSDGAGAAFPYPGAYRNAHCLIEIQEDGRFEMRGMDCAYPWSNADGSITVSARGWARIRDGHLLLAFSQVWKDPDLDFLVMQCRGGPRFLPPDEQRDFVLAIHSQDDYDMRWRSGFATSPGRDGTGYDCDLGPLPPGLLRIAEAPPIKAKVRSVATSKCKAYDDGADCEATLAIDRGEAHGLVPAMDLYFPDCTDLDYSMSVRSVSPDTATLEFGWSAATEAHASRYIGTELTTRMPECLAGERERRNQQAQVRYEMEQAKEKESE